MPKTEIRVPDMSLGYKARRLALRAKMATERLKTVSERGKKFATNVKDIGDTNMGFRLFSFLMLPTWIALMIWEYHISQEMYIEYAQGAPYIIPIALFLFSILPAAMIAEFWHPIFTSTHSLQHIERTRGDHIRGEQDIPYLKWVLLLLGIVISVGTANFLFGLSSERVLLMQQAGESDSLGNLDYQRYLPAVLFLAEVIVGVFMIYCFQLIIYYVGTRLYTNRKNTLMQISGEMKERTVQTYHSHMEDVDEYKELSGNSLDYIPPNEELKEILGISETDDQNNSTELDDEVKSVHAEPDKPTPSTDLPGAENVIEEEEEQQNENQDLLRQYDQQMEENLKEL